MRALAAICWLGCAARIGSGEASADAWPEWQRPRVALDRCLVREEFRIYYAMDGPDALPEAGRADADRDGVCDKIQDLAVQLIAARRMYADVMGLRHPFDSPRYRGRVRYFDVHVRTLPNRGTAGDAIVNYHRPTDPSGGVEVLSIDIDRGIDTRNLTPAHELFHEFQNGYALFKNAWYTEGMARWAEHAFRSGTGRAIPPPRDGEEVRQLLRLDYAAGGFWNALASLADPAGEMRLPDAIRGMRYLGDDVPIVEDDRLHGAVFIKSVLEELDRADDVVSREAGLDPLDWPEARQRSPENNPSIWGAVAVVCRRHGIRLPECPSDRLPRAMEGRSAEAPVR